MVQERFADQLTSLHASRGLVYRLARRRAAGTETHADVAMATPRERAQTGGFLPDSCDR
jgi:alkylation response protein AidB-like acyl-CoA dehydrogenase